MIIDVVKIFILSTSAFTLSIGLSFVISKYLYKFELWKKAPKSLAVDGTEALVFKSLHGGKEIGTPKMGGIIIWLGAVLAIGLFWLLAQLLPNDVTTKLDLLSRDQTWLPLATLILGGLIGLVDDWLDIKGSTDHLSGGLSLKKRLALVAAIALACALWFYFKLDVGSIGLPNVWGSLELGLFFIPFFVLVTIALYSGGIIDGIDGLAGGLFGIMFAAYAAIAFYQNQINLAAFCAVVVGAILSFLWFNIPPARYYMSETGSMALTVTLAVVAFMTDSLGEGHSIIALPIIALPLVVTVASAVIQLLSKKYRGKKVFLIAPLHHHFEALGWPSYKVTMRYWVIGIIFAIIGVTVALIG